MVARIQTVAFQGLQAVPVDVQALLAPGMVAFTIVGLPDKAVAESRERVRATLQALGLMLPAKRITINLAPADLQKEGSHFDLPIALALLAAMGGAIPHDVVAGSLALGELALDGQIAAVSGVLPAAITALAENRTLICPAANGPEALWAGEQLPILAPPSLLALVNHFKGSAILTRPTAPPPSATPSAPAPDLRDVRGQESGKRALEIAATGGHHLLLMGPPGSGKSMLAARLPPLLPPLTATEALTVTTLHSLAGQLPAGAFISTRPFRDPHHSASLPALVGGGMRVRPGEISLAHGGVLFLDELPEFQRPVLEALRQPLETGEIMVARANQHARYPAQFQLVAAMNPCRCGYLGDAARACTRAPTCGTDYQARISGPLLDRFDLQLVVEAVPLTALATPQTGEPSATVAARVAAARRLQAARFASLELPYALNREASGETLRQICGLSESDEQFLQAAASKLQLSARGYARVQRVARTIADLATAASHAPETDSASLLAAATAVNRLHLAEALAFRRG